MKTLHPRTDLQKTPRRTHPETNQLAFLRLPILCSVIACMLLASSPSFALTKAERKEIKRILANPLYLKVDAPCATGRHAFGTYKRPLVEITPEKVNTDGDLVFNSSWWHADSTYWGVQINDRVKVEEVEFEDDDGEVEVELETTETDSSTVILFVDIVSLDDFKTAFDLAFSEVPLQDQHEDWSDEFKQAVADRQLRNGMNKRQVFYITGSPERFEKRQEDGQEVEIWNLRQDKGTKIGFFMAKTGESTGFPETVRFEDGQLVDVGTSGTGDEFSLD